MVIKIWIYFRKKTFPNLQFFLFRFFFSVCLLGSFLLGAVVVAGELSCPKACGILVPQARIEPMSPALEGGFLTTGWLGKSL